MKTTDINNEYLHALNNAILLFNKEGYDWNFTIAPKDSHTTVMCLRVLIDSSIYYLSIKGQYCDGTYTFRFYELRYYISSKVCSKNNFKKIEDFDTALNALKGVSQ